MHYYLGESPKPLVDMNAPNYVHQYVNADGSPMFYPDTGCPGGTCPASPSTEYTKPRDPRLPSGSASSVNPVSSVSSYLFPSSNVSSITSYPTSASSSAPKAPKEKSFWDSLWGTDTATSIAQKVKKPTSSSYKYSKSSLPLYIPEQSSGIDNTVLLIGGIAVASVVLLLLLRKG